MQSTEDILAKRKKEPKKENTTGNCQLATGKGSTQNRKAQSTEVDDLLHFLDQLGVYNPEFHDWYAKCIYTLGSGAVRKLAIASTNGRHRAKLFSFKLKAHYEHFLLREERRLVDNSDR